MWLPKVVAIFTHKSSLLHRISPAGSIYSKTKIRYIFCFHSSFSVLIFTFDMHVWMTYLFCVIKNNWNNIRCATEGEKSNKCCARNHTLLFVSLREQLKKISVTVISLLIFRENSLSKGEILNNKHFYKIINQWKFLFTTLTRLNCIKH